MGRIRVFYGLGIFYFAVIIAWNVVWVVRYSIWSVGA